jgi:hypothetical protein
MILWRSIALALVVPLVGLGGACVRPAAAAASDPDWPCVQRLVPEIAPAVVWAGPPIEAVNGGALSPAIDQLAAELAARRVPLDEAKARIDAFAESLSAEQKDAQLTQLFARALEIINRDRASIIEGIGKYARGERALAASISAKNDRLSALPADRVLERQQLIAERDWDIRIYDDRRSALPYLCDQPVVLEQRAFALGRAIAAHLE